MPGWKLHPLAGDLAGHWSVGVNGNWRMTFVLEGENAILVDYRGYHRGKRAWQGCTTRRTPAKP